MPFWLAFPDWLDIVDIALVAAFGWFAIRSFRRTRARAALTGLAMVGVIYFVAQGLDLRLTASLLQTFFAVAVIVLVVIFQEDLRRVFEQLGNWRQGTPDTTAEARTVDHLIRAVSHLASTKTGALLVLPGRQPLERHVEGGIPLGGQVSEPLLLSLFDKHSPGHDGAVLLRGSIVERFALHLPLSTNHGAVGAGGTRHAAALGLAERCDATCIVVSEERGTVSIAKDGAIRTLARPQDLIHELRPGTVEDSESTRWWRNNAGLDAAIATAGALVLWLVLVPGATLSERTVLVDVEYLNLPSDLVIESTDPPQVEVTVRGLSRDLLLSDPKEVRVRIDAYLARFGRRTFPIGPQSVEKGKGLSVVSLNPDKVRISLVPAETTAESDPQ